MNDGNREFVQWRHRAAAAAAVFATIGVVVGAAVLLREPSERSAMR